MTTLQEYLSAAAKTYGDGTLSKASIAAPDTLRIETGVFTVDYALLGGIPEGRVTMFTGWEGSAKSTIALKTLANFQNKHPDQVALMADTEDAFDPEWAQTLGVDLERLILVNENNSEKVVDIINETKNVPEIGFVLVDSLAEMMPASEIAKSAQDNQKMAYRALIIGKLMTAISDCQLHKKKLGQMMTFLLINQQRTNPGQMFGDNTVIPGGKQQVFKSTVIVRFAKRKTLTYDTTQGVKGVHSRNEHTFKIKKTRLGPSITDGEFELIVGPDQEVPIGSISDHEVVLGYLKKRGLYTGGGAVRKIAGCDHAFKNKDEACEFLRNHSEFYKVCQARLIALQRLEAGKSALPPDNYLLHHVEDGDLFAGVETE